MADDENQASDAPAESTDVPDQTPAVGSATAGSKEGVEAPAPSSKPGSKDGIEAPAPSSKPGSKDGIEAPAPSSKPGSKDVIEAPAPTSSQPSSKEGLQPEEKEKVLSIELFYMLSSIAHVIF